MPNDRCHNAGVGRCWVRFSTGLLVGLLVGCGQEQETWIAPVTEPLAAQARVDIDPAEQWAVQPLPPLINYHAQPQRSPFSLPPDVVVETARFDADLTQNTSEDSDVSDEEEAVISVLGEKRFVGTLQWRDVRAALLALPSGRIIALEQGDQLDANAQVVRVSANELEIMEQRQDESGIWHPHTVTVRLYE